MAENNIRMNRNINRYGEVCYYMVANRVCFLDAVRDLKAPYASMDRVRKAARSGSLPTSLEEADRSELIRLTEVADKMDTVLPPTKRVSKPKSSDIQRGSIDRYLATCRYMLEHTCRFHNAANKVGGHPSTMHKARHTLSRGEFPKWASKALKDELRELTLKINVLDMSREASTSPPSPAEASPSKKALPRGNQVICLIGTAEEVSKALRRMLKENKPNQ